MLLFLVVVLTISASRVVGLSCFSCTSNAFNGEITYSSDRKCYFNIYDGIFQNQETCANNTGTQKYYCRTMIQLHDGIPIRVERGCISSAYDEDTSTTDIPDDDKCVASVSSSSTTTYKTCYIHCNTSGCNSASIKDDFKVCDSDCGRGAGLGYCDYISGTCICTNGAKTTNCSAEADSPRMCVQCTTETDENCENKTTSSSCPSTERSCATSHTITLNQDGNQVRSVLSKFCTSDMAQGRCKFDSIYNDQGIRSAGYLEINCYLICESNNCNANTTSTELQISLTSEKLYCRQCKGIGQDCHNTAACPYGSTHCKATATYVMQGSSYSLLRIVRECALREVVNNCTEEKIAGTEFIKMFCQETCLGSVCNNKLPGLRRCYHCSDTYYGSSAYYSGYYGGHHCFVDNNYYSTTCSNPSHKYCVTRHTTNKMKSGYITSTIRRECSSIDIGSGCSNQTTNGVTIETCNSTCTTDNCNSDMVDIWKQDDSIVAVSYYLP